MIERAGKEKKAISVGVLGNAAEMLPELVRRGVKPDAVTDQTSAHDPVNGYLPAGWTLAEWQERRERDPKGVERAAKESMAVHVRAMLDFWRAGVPMLDYGNNIRQMAQEMGVDDAFEFPGLRAGLYPPAVLPRRRAVPLGRAVGRSGGHLPHRPAREGADAARQASAQLARHGAARIKFQGLPARICWVGLGDRHRLGLAFNEMVAKRRAEGADRDRARSSRFRLGREPNRETEAMKDGSDAVSDWPLLNALLNCASGATWVSFHHGGGVGIGYSQHAGMVIVARRHAGGGAAARARAVERSGDRRDAPRRCRLRGSDRLGEAAGAEAAES